MTELEDIDNRLKLVQSAMDMLLEGLCNANVNGASPSLITSIRFDLSNRRSEYRSLMYQRQQIINNSKRGNNMLDRETIEARINEIADEISELRAKKWAESTTPEQKEVIEHEIADLDGERSLLISELASLGGE